jgi:hypothetical protein
MREGVCKGRRREGREQNRVEVWKGKRRKADKERRRK